MRTWCFLILILTAMLICTACAPVISPDVRAGLDRQLSFANIMEAPEAHLGKRVMLAGTILEAKNLPQGTRLEILQFPHTRRGRPATEAPSGGRFMVMSSSYLETAIYRPGRAITVAGQLTDVQSLPLGETIYRYPLLVPQELYLWSEKSDRPQFHFGFGIGFSKGF